MLKRKKWGGLWPGLAMMLAAALLLAACGGAETDAPQNAEVAEPAQAETMTEAAEVEETTVEEMAVEEEPARPGPRPGQRGHVVHEVLAKVAVGLRIPCERVPRPQTDEVVAVALEKSEIGVVIERGRRVGLVHVDQIVPGVRAGQIDRPERPIRILGPVREVARIGRMDPQRAGGSLGLAGARTDRMAGRQGQQNRQKTSSADLHSVFLSYYADSRNLDEQL